MEVMIEVGEWPGELIICLLNVLKSNFVDVDEAMFHDVVNPLERILNILCIQKDVMF
jgi:hypothetical protein